MTKLKTCVGTTAILILSIHTTSWVKVDPSKFYLKIKIWISYKFLFDTKMNFWNRVVFRGSREDKAVLCTDDKTFEVKEAETSNSLLLLPTLKLAEECEGSSENRPLEEKEVGFVS